MIQNSEYLVTNTFLTGLQVLEGLLKDYEEKMNIHQFQSPLKMTVQSVNNHFECFYDRINNLLAATPTVRSSRISNLILQPKEDQLYVMLNQYKTINKQLKQQKQNVQEQKISLQSIINTNSKEIICLKSTNEQLNNNVAQQNKQIQSLKHVLASIADELDVQKQQKQKNQIQLNKYKEKISFLQSDINQLNQQINYIIVSKNQLQRVNKQLSMEINNQKIILTQSSQKNIIQKISFQKQYQSKLQFYKNKIKLLEQQIIQRQKVQKNIEIEKIELVKKNQLKQIEIKKLSDEINKLKNQTYKIQEVIAKKLQQKQNWIQQLVKKSMQNADLWQNAATSAIAAIIHT